MAMPRAHLLLAGAGAGVVVAALVLVPWLICDRGVFGLESQISCRLDQLRRATDGARYDEALDRVSLLLDNRTPTRSLLKAHGALQDGLSRGFDGPTQSLLGWVEQVLAERRARALQMRDELEPRIDGLRVPVDPRIPAERFPVRATLVLWESGESIAQYALSVQRGGVAISKGDGGLPRVYVEPEEFRTLYDAAKDGIGLEDWSPLLGLAGKVVVEGR